MRTHLRYSLQSRMGELSSTPLTRVAGGQVVGLLLPRCCCTSSTPTSRCCSPFLPMHCCFGTATPPVVHGCCTAAARLLHCCSTGCALVLHRCCTAAAMLLHRFCTGAALLLHGCCTDAPPVGHYRLLLSSGRRPPVCQSLAAAGVSGRWVKSGPRQSLVADCWPLVVPGGADRLLTSAASCWQLLVVAGGRWSPAIDRWGLLAVLVAC